MYEDSRDLDKTQDSDNESYSYPSYSRFTFTGKPKSRLGRHNKQARSTVGKNDGKELKVTNSGDNLLQISGQTVKTPGINGLSRDGSSYTNPFTSGFNLFKFPKNVPEGQQPSNTGRETDTSSSSVPSQSNFFSTWKSDSAQIQNCNRNFTFKISPLKGVGNCDNNLVKEQNHYLTKTPISKLNFSSEKKEINKENIERKLSTFSKQESPLDPSWNQLKKMCDSAVSYPTKLSENINFVSGNNRTNFGRTTAEPFRPILPSFPVFDAVKDDDDSTNAPLDLSSGDSLTNKTLLNRSATGSDQSHGTVVSLGGSVALKTEQEKLCDRDGEGTKPRNSSDAIDSILPVFLAPINKTKSKEFDANGKFNGKCVQASSQTKNSNLEFKTNRFLPFDEFRSPFVPPVASTTSNVQSISNKIENVSEKQNEHKQVNDNDGQHCSQQNLFNQPKDIKENMLSNMQTESVSSQNLLQPVKSASENMPDTLVSSINEMHISPKENNSNVHIDLLQNSCTALKSTSNLVIERLIPADSNQAKVDKNTVANVDNNVIKIENKELNSIKQITMKIPSPPHVTEANEQMPSNSEEISNPSEGIEILSPQSAVPSILSNCVNNTSKPFQTDVKQSESNHQEPICPQPLPMNLPKVEENLHGNFVKSQELKIQEPLMKVVESSENHLKQYPVQQHYMPIKKQTLPNPDSVGLKQRNEGSQKCPTYIQQQKTYLAPPSTSENRLPNNDFPYKKPEVPHHISSRPSFAMDKPHNSYKMPTPRGRLPRGSSDLFVNGNVYSLLSTLGRGGSSEVYQVLDPRSSKLLAVKCVDLSMVDKTIADGYLNEIDLLSKLQGCSSVIKMFDYEYVQEYKMLYVVLEKGDTDLSQLIRDISKTKKISMSMIIYYWTEMLTAVNDIHQEGIIHSDLKPANFLLVSGRLKLIDFGIASSQGDMTSVVKEVTTGTWNYMSPEAIRNTSTSGKGFKITYKSDVWSLGCILYNLVYGKTPFSHITNTWGKLQAIADSSHQIDFPDVGAPLVLSQALRSCFHRDPKLRPTVAELLSLPYHATCDTSHIGRQLHTILPQEWWHKVAHLFPDTKSEDKSETAENKCPGTKADLT